MEHQDSRQQMGIIQAAYRLRDSGGLAVEDLAALLAITRWLNRNVDAPDDPDPRAIFWFKPAASEARRVLWDLAQLLRAHGYLVELLKTDRPGRLVYEDELQVAAIPFRDTF
jgi:hypothetical protein